MILRTWRARAAAENPGAYGRYFADKVVPALKRLAGHRGAWLLRREIGGRTEYLAMTLWESRDSIKAFAGDDISKSHVEPEGRAVLADFDPHADHYEVVVSPSS